jgi:hypothetical protein
MKMFWYIGLVVVQNLTNTQGRMVLGIGGVINTHHEGPVKRSTEEIALLRTEGQVKPPPLSRRSAAPMNNPAFLGDESEKKK